LKGEMLKGLPKLLLIHNSKMIYYRFNNNFKN
jgi:hypothetical protein